MAKFIKICLEGTPRWECEKCQKKFRNKKITEHHESTHTQ